jgi:glycine hydroxymethyltransferase
MLSTAQQVNEQPDQNYSVHDNNVLQKARFLLDACQTFEAMGEHVKKAVERNAKWRGNECINLLAPEAPTSPGVRSLLAAEIGTRAAEGHIGPTNRWFAGTRYIDEVEALCMELLKQLFKANYADHRLCASMIGNAVVYTALTQPGDVIMSIAQPYGGHSSNRSDGPAGSRGLKIIDIPMDPIELTVDLDAFRQLAPLVRPKLITLGLSMALFPFPIQPMQAIIQEWNGRIFFDGAHQLGLIAGGQYQDPLAEGATIMTGSAGKTFSGPQSGVLIWNDPAITKAVTHAVFPTWAATHQVNRVAALALATAEMLAFGKIYMAQIVQNARALGVALHERGVPMLAAHKGFTCSHQVIADVRQFGGGLAVAKRLEQANIITNKNLIPTDLAQDWDNPGGLRIGTTEVTRLGMHEPEMAMIADFFADVLIKELPLDAIKKRVIDFRHSFQKIYYCFENGYPVVD